MATTAGVAWKLKGTVIVACNCDFGCPCNFNALPSSGKCEGGWTWHVDEGTFGETSLDGLAFSVFVNWPGAIHEGNGEAVIYVDERAMRLGYSGTMRGAPFVTEAVNHWSVLPGGANASIVATRGYVEMAFVPWALLAPLVYVGIRWLGQRTAEDLKYYVEHGAPHPRKLKTSPRQRPTPR